MWRKLLLRCTSYAMQASKLSADDCMTCLDLFEVLLVDHHNRFVFILLKTYWSFLHGSLLTHCRDFQIHVECRNTVPSLFAMSSWELEACGNHAGVSDVLLKQVILKMCFGLGSEYIKHEWSHCSIAAMIKNQMVYWFSLMEFDYKENYQSEVIYLVWGFNSSVSCWNIECLPVGLWPCLTQDEVGLFSSRCRQRKNSLNLQF